MRDIKADVEAALIQEHDGYVRAGRKADAEGVAKVLKDEYGHDVAKQSDSGDGAAKAEKQDPAPERADVQKAPENTAEPKPRRGPRAKPGPTDSK